MPKKAANSQHTESRFQWSLQRSVKIKAIPWLVSELYSVIGEINLPEMEDRFNFRYGIIKSVGVVDNQRPFMRTLDFLKNDLSILNEDYSLKSELISELGYEQILEKLYGAALEHFIPFQIMIELLTASSFRLHPWEDFKLNLSREMMSKAMKDFPMAFAMKNRKESRNDPSGVFGWRMDDNSINRLVELGMLFGICSFVVLDHVRFVSIPDWKNNRRDISIDFSDLIAILQSNIDGFGPTMILTLDQVYLQTDKLSIQREVIEDALLSGGRRVSFFSGGVEGASSMKKLGTNYYSVRFNEECFINE